MEKNIGDVVKTGELEKYLVEVSKNTEKLTPIDTKSAHNFMSAFKQAVLDYAAQGAKIQLTGLFTIYPVYKPEREGTNMLTNEPFHSPERASVLIKTGGNLREAYTKLPIEKVHALRDLKNK